MTFLRIDERAVAETTELLKRFQQPKLDRLLQRAASSGAGALRVPIRQAAPVKKDPKAGKRGEGYGTPGDLAKSVKVARVRNVVGVASVVGPMGRKAFTRYWVIRGTRQHTIEARAQGSRQQVSLRAAISNVLAGRRHVLAFVAGGTRIFRRQVHHPGARANNFVERAAQPHLPAVRERMVRTIVRAATKEGFIE